MSIKCKNCTLVGTIDLSGGSFSVNPSNSSSNDSEVLDFIENGFVRLQVNDIAAHMEFESNLQPSQSLGSYEIPLPTIGITVFQVNAPCLEQSDND